VNTQGDPPVVYVCGLVAYDGTAYHGFQVQAGVPTIQGTLEDALRKVTTLEGRLSGAGRTDAGVHACGQVVAVKVHWRHSVSALQRAWNAHLPPAIVIRQLALAPATFHPRFSALSRTYRYVVICGQSEDIATAQRSPLTDRFALYEPGTLALTAMQEASRCLIGEHDFATFGNPPQGEQTMRRVFTADWQVVESNLPALRFSSKQQFVFTITANGFLQQMVRNLVGSLLEVGRGRWSVADMQTALLACNRRLSAPPARPNGLTLELIKYPAELDIL
jgi:tRNA pseudouridine38-40 synthase